MRLAERGCWPAMNEVVASKQQQPSELLWPAVVFVAVALICFAKIVLLVMECWCFEQLLL